LNRIRSKRYDQLRIGVELGAKSARNGENARIAQSALQRGNDRSAKQLRKHCNARLHLCEDLARVLSIVLVILLGDDNLAAANAFHVFVSMLEVGLDAVGDGDALQCHRTCQHRQNANRYRRIRNTWARF
jgi:hypothetical protein